MKKNILYSIEKKGLLKRYLLFIIGSFISALAYNLFFLKSGLMSGGAGGVAILFKGLIDPSITIGVTYKF